MAADEPPGDEDDRAFLRRCGEQPATVDVEALFDRLDAADTDRRRVGARGLSELARAAPDRLAAHGDAVADYLEADDATVRSAAVAAVRHLVHDEDDAFDAPPVAALAARLGREDQQTSRRVAETLATLLDGEDARLADAVDRTVDLFGGETRQAGSAIQALAVLGRRHPETVVDRVGARLADDDSQVRRYAARTLATLADDHPELVAPATDDLVALLDADDDYAREHALSSLVAVAGAEPDRLADGVARLTALVDAEAESVRRGAVRTLAELGRASVDLSEAVATLRHSLDDADKLVRRDAAYTLGVLRAEAAREDLQALTAADDLELAAVASAAVERIDSGEATPPLVDLEPGEVFVARTGR